MNDCVLYESNDRMNAPFITIYLTLSLIINYLHNINVLRNSSIKLFFGLLEFILLYNYSWPEKVERKWEKKLGFSEFAHNSRNRCNRITDRSNSYYSLFNTFSSFDPKMQLVLRQIWDKFETELRQIWGIWGTFIYCSQVVQQFVGHIVINERSF